MGWTFESFGFISLQGGRDFLFSALLMLKILDFQTPHCVMGNLNCMLHSVTSQKTRILRFSFHQFVHTASATEPTLGAVGTEGSFPRSELPKCQG